MAGGDWYRQQLKHWSWVDRVRSVALWQLVVLFVLSLIISATFLRLNNVGMVERRQAVFNADSSADEEAMVNRLYDLQRYSAAHMNADTGDVYLDKKYQRDVKLIAEQVRAQSVSDDSNSVAKQAVNICEQRYSDYSMAYIQCVRDEQDKVPASAGPVDKITFPNKAFYLHGFTSPAWSSDFAGWSVILSLGLFVWIVFKLIELVAVKVFVRRHYQNN